MVIITVDRQAVQVQALELECSFSVLLCALCLLVVTGIGQRGALRDTPRSDPRRLLELKPKAMVFEALEPGELVPPVFKRCLFSCVTL